MALVDNDVVKGLRRRSKKVKDLEKEVELILSQEESDEDLNSSGNKSKITFSTPSTHDKEKEASSPIASHSVLNELPQTPRRSSRKSFKPSQDYDDIISKSMRSSTRSAKKNLLVTVVEVEKGGDNQENEIIQPKWTPAKVGRVSQKRGRKSRRNGRGKKKGPNELEVGNIKEEETEGIQELMIVDEREDNIEEVKISKKGKLEKDLNITEVNPDNIMVEEGAVVNEEVIMEDKPNSSNENKLKDSEEPSNHKAELNTISERTVQEECENKIEVSEDDRSVDLLQEEAGDCKEIEHTSLDEDLCIIYENNTFNEIKTENDNLHFINTVTSSQSEEHDETFGCYLKSKEINISDLGLNPIKDEDDKYSYCIKSKNATETLFDEIEEMPSLIVCDENEEGYNEVQLIPNNKLNETFDANDSVELVEDLEKIPLKLTEELMEPLQISDDDSVETPKKQPRIVQTDNEMQKQTILSTPKGLAIKTKLPGTPKALAMNKLPSTPKGSDIKTKLPVTPKALAISKLSSTPKHSAKTCRFPTPYRNKQVLNLDKDEKEECDDKVTTGTTFNNISISFTTLEPKEIVIRGIRKRSLSLCIDGNKLNHQNFLPNPPQKTKQDRMVSFYSPANQTTIIDELDVVIAKSLKKEKSQKAKDALNKYVTTRRKRSMSFDDSIISTSQISKLPRPVLNKNLSNKMQNPTSSTSKPLTRTKLPNFAAIHQKQFQKMENLIDHVTRKQERSKNLINSVTKLKPVSAQKNVPIVKNNGNIPSEKPKASKKIDLGFTQINKSINNSTIATVTNRAQETVVSTKVNLPDPRLGLNKPLKLGKVTQRQPQQQQIKKYLKPLQITNIEKSKISAKSVPQKPTFNLSTSLMIKPITSTISSKANTSLMNNEDKMASRLQRHMNMFKGRGVSIRDADVTTRKNDILRGVRSNRRFELQMQHRRNMK